VLTCLQQSFGLGVALLVLAVARLAGHERLPETPQAGILAFTVASGLVQYALAFWLHLVGLRRLPVGVAALFLTLTPFFGMAGGCSFSARR
jgi:drug/metabolite transporter (DMT)-like permease